MNKKAVFFDIDGTLWRRGIPVPDSAIEAIRIIREKGHLAFINSGRSKAHIIGKNLMDIEWDGIVSGCGTLVTYGDEILHRVVFPQEEWQRIINLAHDCRVRLIIEGEEHLYFDDEDYLDDPYGQTLIRELKGIRRTIRNRTEPIIAGKFSVDIDENADRERWFAGLNDRYHFIQHSTQVFEVVPAGYSKSTGIDIICARLNIPREDIIAFGDSVNDEEMMRHAGIGIAMGNAIDRIKSIADFVTDNVENDGVKNALSRLGLV